jgi:hypothetical protein
MQEVPAQGASGVFAGQAGEHGIRRFQMDAPAALGRYSCSREYKVL